MDIQNKNLAEELDILGDISDFDIQNVGRPGTTKGAVSSREVDSGMDSQTLFTMFDSSNPFSTSTFSSSDSTSVAEKPAQRDLFENMELVSIEQDLTKDLHDSVERVSDSKAPKTEYMVADAKDGLSSAWPDKKPKAFPAYASYASYADTAKQHQGELSRNTGKPKVSSNLYTAEDANKDEATLCTKGESGSIATEGSKFNPKGRGKVTFGTVQRKYYSEQDSISIETLLSDEIFHYRNYVKLQEEHTSALRRIAKVERQLEEVLQKKNSVQLELLEADRKLSKLETREALYIEKENKFQGVLMHLQNELTKAKEEALSHERKSARLERLIDELNDKRRKDQEILQTSQKKVCDLESRLKDIEKDFECNQSFNLRNMKELSGSTAKLEHEREENSELRITVDCLQDKLRNAEESANRALREKATLYGELNVLRGDIDRWKKETKAGKMKYEEIRTVADKYRSQYQEQKDLIENVMKARRQLENEVHENMVLAERRDAQNKQYLIRINELEESVSRMKRENENLKEKFIERIRERKRYKEDSHDCRGGDCLYAGERESYTPDRRKDDFLTIANELHKKVLLLEEENLRLKSDLQSEKLKTESHYQKIQYYEREKKMQERELDVQKSESATLQREIRDLKIHIDHLIKTKGTTVGDHITTWDRDSEKQSELSKFLVSRDFHKSEPQLYVVDSITTEKKSPRTYYPMKDRVSSMPNLNKDTTNEVSSATYKTYKNDYGYKNHARANDYSTRDRKSEEQLGWITSAYLRSKYGISPRYQDYHSDRQSLLGKERSPLDTYHFTASPRYGYVGKDRTEALGTDGMQGPRQATSESGTAARESDDYNIRRSSEDAEGGKTVTRVSVTGEGVKNIQRINSSSTSGYDGLGNKDKSIGTAEFKPTGSALNTEE